MRSPKITIPLILLLLFVTMSPVLALDEWRLDVQEFTLDNGLKFLVLERHTAPVFSGYICIGAGSAYERIGNIGTAHLLEHMMFKGSREIGTTDYPAESELMLKEDSVWAEIDRALTEMRYLKVNRPEQAEQHQQYIDQLRAILDSLAQLSSEYVVQNEFDLIYTVNGAAQFNAVTGYDMTNYFVSLPANRLELWFAMEAGRLKFPAFREFFPERDVVSEERRQSVENSPEAKLFEQFIGTAFIAHPYQIFWEWQSEENMLTRDDLQRFFDTYYVPQNMTVTIVGDVTLDEVRRLAEKHFGDLNPGPDPEPIYTREPEQPGERRIEVILDANPVVSIGYHKTAFDHPDEAAFEIINRLLSQGRTSRLFKSLVLEQQLCLNVSAYTFPGGQLGDRHSSLFCIDAYPKEGISTLEVEKAIYAELERLSTEPVDEKELTKIKNNIEAGFIWASYSNIGLAGVLAKANTLARDWHFIERLRERLHAVTPEDIQRVAGEYFNKNNRTVATLVPKEKGAEQ